MKKLYALFFLAPLFANAQPAGYYNGANGLQGQPLRVALHNIIKNHTALNYGGSTLPNTWTTFQTSDIKQNGKVWDIYSDKPGLTPPYEFTFVTDQCGNYNSEADCYNHEHTWPQSYFNESAPMKSDLFHIYPTDGYVNGKRSNYQYGVVTAPTWTSQNGSKLGNNTYNGSSGISFEPIDSFKGDIARTYFYMTTRYYSEDGAWQSWEMANKAELKQWAINMLLDWHHNDPVSNKEIARNNAIYGVQNNRNPFIDNPLYADCIWGNANCSSVSATTIAGIGTRIKLYPMPATNEVTIDWNALSPDEVLAVDIVNVQGQYIFHQDVNGVKQLSITTNEWAKGLYLLQIKTKHGTQAKKLVVQ